MSLYELKPVMKKARQQTGRNIRMSDIVNGTELSRDTVAGLYHQKCRSISERTMKQLCIYFRGVGVCDVQPRDFVVEEWEHSPPKKTKEEVRKDHENVMKHKPRGSVND